MHFINNKLTGESFKEFDQQKGIYSRSLKKIKQCILLIYNTLQCIGKAGKYGEFLYRILVPYFIPFSKDII